MKKVKTDIATQDPELRRRVNEFGQAINRIDEIHSKDGQTRVYIDENDQVHIYTASTERVIIGSGGKLTPKYGIWDTDGDTGIQVEESADEDKVRIDTAGTERVVVDSTGNVGIGTSPSQKLHVNGLIRLAGGIFNNEGGVIGLDAANGNMAFTSGANTKGFRFLLPDYTGLMTILNTGNVGIGKTPSCKVDVEGTIRATETTDPSSGEGIELLYVTSGNIRGKIHAYDRNNSNYEILALQGSNFHLLSNGDLQIDGKLTESGCPQNIKQIWKSMLETETAKPEPPKDKNGKIIKPRPKDEMNPTKEEEAELEQFYKDHYHNTGEMVMASAHGILEQQQRIESLEVQIGRINKN